MAPETCCDEAVSESSLCAQILAKIPASVLIFDIATASISYSNQSMMKFLGYESDTGVLTTALLDQLTHPDDLVHAEEAREFLSQAQDGEYINLEQRFRHADGSWRWLYVRLVVFARDRCGNPTKLLGLTADITSNKQRQEEFERDASHDFLTGLLNRRYLIRSLEQLLARGKPAVSICLCDIDHFKEVNDTYGHLKGDEVLQAFSTIARKILAKRCIVGRLGGDEFCIVFPGATASVAKGCVERIRKNFAAKQFVAETGAKFTATASFGLADWEPKMDWREFLNCADKALFEAKRKGRNLVS